MGEEEKAYRRGQADMRRRIERQWKGWMTNGIGAMQRARKTGVGDVSLRIRKENPILPPPVPRSD